MIINLSPQRRNDTLTVIKEGDKLTINGVDYDFSEMPNGSTLPLFDTETKTKNVDCEWICSDVSRIDNELVLTLILPHGANASESACFPQPLNNPPDGLLELPQ
jgi:hypothetical protein